MSEPKRHHWWPQLNSGFWCDETGSINVLNRDGSNFRGKPKGLGVVGHLYSKELEDGKKDTSIETWFANEVDGPFMQILTKLNDETQIKRYRFQGKPEKAQAVKELGYRISDYVEYFDLSKVERECISKYVSALLVRSPIYLEKLTTFHKAALQPKNSALENMKFLFGRYFEKIMKADLMLVKRDAGNEFLFSDGGIVAREPWSRNGGIPFDVHFPVTPDLALQVLPAMKQAFPNRVIVTRAANKAISGHNRITLQHAVNQVFGRGPIPTAFVMKNWGRKAPKYISFRHVEGNLETKVDWSRFYY